MKIKYRKMKKGEVGYTEKLVRDTFRRFNRHEGTKEGVKNYIKIHSPKKSEGELWKKHVESEEVCIVAIDGRKIIGVIKGYKGRIYNLFVNGKYHRKGIAKELLRLFEKEDVWKNNRINVKSSLYAVPFYQKNGFKKTIGIRMVKFLEGLKYQPLVKVKR